MYTATLTIFTSKINKISNFIKSFQTGPRFVEYPNPCFKLINNTKWKYLNEEAYFIFFPNLILKIK